MSERDVNILRADGDLDQPSELVFGVVAPLGTDLRETITALEEGLRLAGYTSRTIRLSELLKSWDHLGVDLKLEPESERLRTFMAAGTKAREHFGRADILVLGAVNQIAESRSEGGAPMPRLAHILLTLKHPDEVRTLRRIYGPGFYLIGVWSSQGDRIQYLVDRMGVHDEKAAAELIQIDADEFPEAFGQKTRNTFQLADVFVRATDSKQVGRFLDLVFGYPFETPTAEEHAMFMAYASSLRSADLSRQVGAVILSANGDLISTGANDVPAPGGGLYWPGPDDARDFVRGKDMNEQRRNEFVIEVMKSLQLQRDGETDRELLARGQELLEGSRILDITEFGRAVHAEMEALLACGRSGVSPRQGTLVCTTFPCHNCAKHIVASGLSRVIYVEPYPKSQAGDLFRDSIVLEDVVEKKDMPSGRVKFSPFTGIGPRRYIDLFSLGLGSGYKLKRKDDNGLRIEWKREKSRVRVPMLPNSYLEREKLASNALINLMPEEHDEPREEEPEH